MLFSTADTLTVNTQMADQTTIVCGLSVQNHIAQYCKNMNVSSHV